MTRPVLYLPGLDGEAFCAEKLSQHTTARLHVFRYPVGRAFDWPELCSLVAARLQALGTGLLAGESFGGAVAQETVFRYPQSVRSLLLLSTFNTEPEKFAATLGRVAVKLLPTGMTRLAARVLGSWKLAGTLRGEERTRFLDRLAAQDHTEFARRLKLLQGFDSRARLADVKNPVRVVYGSRDPICAKAETLQVWQRIGATVHEIKGLGHLVVAEAAPEVGAIVDAWVSESCKS
jgi:pimeloyl-ACP methyl ester carboxylesterase